jgi:hypothetical protein
MLRVFSFLPPIGFYVLAVAVLAATYSFHSTLMSADPEADTNQVWLVGGIFAFLLAFGGVQKRMEEREQAAKPRVSSADVLQKLTPTETGKKDGELDLPPPSVHGPDANSPLGRVRARSNPLEL